MIGRWTRFKPRKTAQDVDRALRFLVRHAARTVPFYRDLWSAAGVRASDIHGVADLPRLPITDRQQLLLRGTDGFLQAGANVRRLHCRHTTGTTGTPVSVYMTRGESTFRALTLLDSFRRNVKLSLPMTLVDVGPEQKDRSTQPVRRVGPIRVVRLFRTMPVQEQIEWLSSTKPALIEGRPSMLWHLAAALEASGTTPPRPRLIVSYAEALYPGVRTLLERTFGCHVADYYNCEETGNIAWECPQNPGTMHINTATTWLEVVNSKGVPVPPGSDGNVLITNLFNATMPMIRYALRDRATLLEPGHCSCSHAGLRMQLVDGRDEDFFVLPDSRSVSPRIAYDIVNRALPASAGDGLLTQAMTGFQIVQQTPNQILVRVIPGPEYDPSLWANLGDCVRALHPDMQAHVELVDNLDPGPGKKFKQVMSLAHGTCRALGEQSPPGSVCG